MVYRNYRTRDGLVDYGFSFERQADGSWRAYIEDQPGYLGHAEDQHSTHRMIDDGRPYVCWTSALLSYADVTKVAALWAEATERYRKNGAKF